MIHTMEGRKRRDVLQLTLQLVNSLAVNSKYSNQHVQTASRLSVTHSQLVFRLSHSQVFYFTVNFLVPLTNGSAITLWSIFQSTSGAEFSFHREPYTMLSFFAPKPATFVSTSPTKDDVTTSTASIANIVDNKSENDNYNSEAAQGIILQLQRENQQLRRELQDAYSRIRELDNGSSDENDEECTTNDDDNDIGSCVSVERRNRRPHHHQRSSNISSWRSRHHRGKPAVSSSAVKNNMLGNRFEQSLSFRQQFQDRDPYGECLRTSSGTLETLREGVPAEDIDSSTYSSPFPRILPSLTETSIVSSGIISERSGEVSSDNAVADQNDFEWGHHRDDANSQEHAHGHERNRASSHRYSKKGQGLALAAMRYMARVGSTEDDSSEVSYYSAKEDYVEI
jgi:hypothetical protein